MRKLAIATTAVVIASGATFVYAQNQLDTVMDLAVQGMLSEGASVTYDDRNIGGDMSVEYTNLVITDPDDGITISMDWLKGTPSASDAGVVTFTVADVITIEGDVEGEHIDFEIRSVGFELTTNAVLKEAFDDGDISVTLMADSFTVDGGDPDSAVVRKFMTEMTDLNFGVVFSIDDMTVAGNLSSGEYDAKYDITIEDQIQVADQQVEFMDMTFAFDVPEGEEDMIGYLTGEKTATLKLESGDTTFDSTINQEGMEFQYAGTSDGGVFNFEMVDGRMVYDMVGGAMEVLVTPGAGIPIPPVAVALAEIGMKFVMPMNSGDEPDEMAIDLLLADLTIGEGLWSIIDPEQTISRDPATLDIDITSSVQIDAMKAMMEGADNPFEVATFHNVAINQFLIAVGGASVQADGAADINNDGFIPMPVGTVNVTVEGVQALTDQLVALGLLDAMQVGMGLGMMMAFAKPGDAADQFVSEIEFTEDGSITANGQPIK